MTDTELILQRLDGIQNQIGHLEARMDNLEVRFDNLEAKVDNLEIGLEGEIQKVYEVTLKNGEDIRLLLLYRDRIINVSNTVSRFDSLEERQRMTEEVVATHSADIRMLKNRLA